MSRKTNNITRTALFASIIAVSAFIRIPIGPVPLTLQSTAVLVAGYCIGPVQGAAAAVIYTIVGLAGVPVFASGGGPAYVFNPTFGYILGFTVCAWLAGFLARFNKHGSVVIAYLIMAVSLSGIYLPGVIWLIISMNWIADVPTPVVSLLKIGFIIPLIGDLLTTVPAAYVVVKLKRIL